MPIAFVEPFKAESAVDWHSPKPVDTFYSVVWEVHPHFL